MASRTKSRSPITMPGYGKGKTPHNKGRKTPAEVLTRDELERLMRAIDGQGKLGHRDRAMVALMFRAGMKVGQVVRMERWHYEPDGTRVTVPAGYGRAERDIPVDETTRKLLRAWWEERQKLDLPSLAPLFCAASEPTPGSHLYEGQVRTMLARSGKRAGIHKRITPSGLKRTYDETTAARSARIVSHLAGHLEEGAFGSRFPSAYEKWRDAFDLYEVGPERHATRIGHDCREAIATFASDLVRLYDVEGVDPAAGTQTKLRAVFAAEPDRSTSVREYCDRLLALWRAMSNLAQRQEHAGLGEPRALTAEDSRRLVFQALVVMVEVDSALRE